MATEVQGLRSQILANAKILLKLTTTFTNPSTASQCTLLAPHGTSYEDMDVVVFGAPGEYVGAIMVGLVPAIEGDRALVPEAAMRKLLLATCELLKTYIPKVGDHQRNIHGGGWFDEDMISEELKEAQKG